MAKRHHPQYCAMRMLTHDISGWLNWAPLVGYLYAGSLAGQDWSGVGRFFPLTSRHLRYRARTWGSGQQVRLTHMLTLRGHRIPIGSVSCPPHAGEGFRAHIKLVARGARQVSRTAMPILRAP